MTRKEELQILIPAKRIRVLESAKDISQIPVNSPNDKSFIFELQTHLNDLTKLVDEYNKDN